MRLARISIKGLRCYGSIVEMPVHSLTVFIGENDSGKTSIVRAIQMLMTNINVSENDFYISNAGIVSEDIELKAIFSLEDSENDGGFSILENDSRKISLIKKYSKNNMRGTTLIYREVYEDNRLNIFTSLSAIEIKSLADELGLLSMRTKGDNIELISHYLSSTVLTMTKDFKEINFSEIEPYLPKYEPVISTDYKDPAATIQSSIQSSINNKIRSINSEEHPMYSIFKGFEEWVDQQIDAEAESIPELIRTSLPNFRDLKVSAKVDLSRIASVSSVSLDLGYGLRPLANYGEGTRKKLWMSLMEWDQKIHDETSLSRSVVRVYDEPDLNLDYAAEKRLFEHISQSSKIIDSKIQNILCTHSVTLIDKAPAETINLIRITEDDVREISYLLTSDGPQVETQIRSFFGDMGDQLKIKNTELFYERGFLVFEGETEEELLPILYRKIFGRTVAEDGLILLNMHTSGNWKTTLEFLGANRKSKTVILLDKDSTFPESGTRISQQSLEEIGFVDGMFFIGQKELEDAFTNDVIARAMQVAFPREDEFPWIPDHIETIRNNILLEKPKFSEDLKNFVRIKAIRSIRNEVKKVTIGRALATCCEVTDVPQEIMDAFIEIRIRAGIQ